MTLHDSFYYHIDGHWNVKDNKVAAKDLLPHILGMIERAKRRLFIEEVVGNIDGVLCRRRNQG